MGDTQININNTVDAKAPPPMNEELYADQKAYRDKRIIMDKQRDSAKYRSVSDGLKFLGGLLVAVGLSAVTHAVTSAPVGVTAFAAAAGATGGLVFIAAAAAITGAAMIADYAASRKGAAVDVDKYEMCAQHIARDIRLELVEGKKIRPMNPQQTAVPEPHYEQNCRADGQQWAAVMNNRQAAPVQEQGLVRT